MMMMMMMMKRLQIRVNPRFFGTNHDTRARFTTRACPPINYTGKGFHMTKKRTTRALPEDACFKILTEPGWKAMPDWEVALAWGVSESTIYRLRRGRGQWALEATGMQYRHDHAHEVMDEGGTRPHKDGMLERLLQAQAETEAKKAKEREEKQG